MLESANFDGNRSCGLRLMFPNFLINMSVWATIEPPARTDAAGIHVQSALPPPGEQGSPQDMKPEPYCAGWR